MVFNSKKNIVDERASDRHDVTEYAGKATLRINLPEDTQSDSMLHHVNIYLRLSGHNKAINLKNFPEIDLGGGHMDIPLRFKDVGFFVQEDSKDCPEMKFEVLIHQAVKPRVIDSKDVRSQTNITQLTSIPTWCTIPFKEIPIGATLDISLSTKAKHKAPVNNLFDFIKKHHEASAETNHQADISANDTIGDLAASGSMENDLLAETDAVVGSTASFGSVITNISQSSFHETLRNKSLSGFSPEFITVTTPPTRPSIDLSKEDLTVLSNVGIVGHPCQESVRKVGSARSYPNGDVMRRGRGNYRGGGSRGHGNHGKRVEQRTHGRGGGSPSREPFQNHSLRSRSIARSAQRTLRGGHNQNIHVYYPSVAAPASAVDCDAERQQSRVSKDAFWAEKAAKSRWKLNDRPGFGVMPATTKRTSVPNPRDIIHKKPSHHSPLGGAPVNDPPVSGITAWNKFASDAAKSNLGGGPSIVVEEPTVPEILASVPAPKLRRGGALFGTVFE